MQGEGEMEEEEVGAKGLAEARLLRDDTGD